MPGSARYITAGVAAVLFAATVSVLAGAWVRPVRHFTNQLTSLVAGSDSAAWSLAWHPVAESEEMKRAVAEQLNFDDAVFAEYTSGNIRVTLYAAYWGPGKMSHRLVATHTPDVCWVGGGWKLRLAGRTSLDSPGTSERQFPAEHRIFERGVHIEHVLFAHYVGRQVITYDSLREPPWYAMLTDLYRMGLRQREEQLFWRISSNRPIAEIQNEPPVQKFLERVARCYLQDQPAGG